jgi:NAD(P)H-hydrate epimerase
MTGSAALSSMAALRTGCGMVHLACPRSAVPVLSTMLKETVLHGMDETEEGALSASARERVLELSAKAGCVCIGPGISHGKETSQLVLELVQTVGKPIVLDADGINAFKDRPFDLKNVSSGLLMTPHKGEWARLFGPLPQGPLDAIKTLRDKAAQFGMTVLYKGAPTIVADPQGKAYVLPFGNSGMATAGSGDVLSGIITSLAAQGLGLTDAAVLGAYVHGEAGNAASDRRNEYSMIAGDMVENIYKAINTLVAE